MITFNHEKNIRRAKADDIPALIEIIRSGFPPHIIDKTIYGSKKIAEYLKAIIGCPLCTNLIMDVCEIDGQIMGYAEFRISRQSAHLNYIAVSNQARGKNVGKSLLKQSLEDLPTSIQKIELSVFDYNHIVHNWYMRLGFVEKSVSGWAEKKLTLIEKKAKPLIPIITNYPQHIANYEYYGFSQMALTMSEQDFTIGVLGDNYFRITDLKLLANGEYLDALSLIDPRRKILAMAEKQYVNTLIEKHDYQRVVDSIFMETTRDQLAINLK